MYNNANWKFSIFLHWYNKNSSEEELRLCKYFEFASTESRLFVCKAFYTNRKYIFSTCSFYLYYEAIFYNVLNKNCYEIGDI